MPLSEIRPGVQTVSLARRALNFACRHRLPEWVQFTLYCMVVFQKRVTVPKPS
jgi:hypothetical protein